MTISHILYGQYHIWDTFGLGLNDGNDGNRGQGTHSAKMGAYSSAENTPIFTPGPHLMRIHLVRYSTSARYEKYSIIHLVRPIIRLMQIFALSTSRIN